MSDIAIRFDGLLLAAAIAFSVLVFAIIAISNLLLAVFADARKRRRFDRAKLAAVFAFLSSICLVGLLVYMDIGPAPTSSIDWLDWITFPWTILFLSGLVGLFRRRRVADETA